MGVKVITGNGKGKTTGAIGLALFALEQGKQAAIVQFLKGNSYAGELFAAQRLGLRIYQFGWGCPWGSLIRSGQMQCLSCGDCFRHNRDSRYGFALKALACVQQLASEGECGLLVLDEVSHALRRGLLTVTDLANLLAKYRRELDFVLTGRQMAADILDLADEVYELKEIKHPFREGIKSRRGIEY